MHQLHPDSSLIPLLRRICGDSVVVHLYNNDLTPDLDTVLADFAEIAGGGGYAPITVDLADFVLSGVSDNKGVLMALPVEFVDGGPDEAYGYYVTNVAGDELLSCARFDGAPLIIPDDNPIGVWPVFGDNSVFSS